MEELQNINVDELMIQLDDISNNTQQLPPKLCYSNQDFEDLINKIPREKIINASIEVPAYCPYLTRYERTELIAVRAGELADDCDPYIKVERKLDDEMGVALKELHSGKLANYWIIRRYPHGQCLCIRVRDLKLRRDY